VIAPFLREERWPKAGVVSNANCTTTGRQARCLGYNDGPLALQLCVRVLIDVPALVIAQGIRDGFAEVAAIHRDVVFEPVAADVLE
jgi:hypothetical protein